MSGTSERGPHLSPGIRRAVAALGLTILGGSPLALDVRCPHCGGTITVKPELFRTWGAKGRVPTCEARRRANVGTHCRPTAATTTEGVTHAG